MGFYSPRLVLNDARRHGIGVLPPHVNTSRGDSTVERDGRAIRVGLKFLLHMPSKLVGVIETEQALRPFEDLADFLRRTRADVDAAASIIRVGALDGLGLTEAGRPPTRDEQLALLPELKAVLAREGVAGDRTLVLAPAKVRARDETDHVSGWSVPRRLGEELARLGLSVTCHPLELCLDDLEARGVTWARDLPKVEDGSFVRVVGLRERAQTPRTRSGRRTCFLTMEDPTGLLDVTVFEDALAHSGETIVKHRVYLAEGILQNNAERGLAIVAKRVMPYLLRAGDTGEAVRLRGGVGLGPMGPTRPGAGAPDEDAWEELGAYADAR
jgi:error-prone DNA polymerase